MKHIKNTIILSGIVVCCLILIYAFVQFKEKSFQCENEDKKSYCGEDGNVYLNATDSGCSNKKKCTGACLQSNIRLTETCSFGCFNGQCIAESKNQSEKNLKFILMIVDGMQFAHYIELKSFGRLPNMGRMISKEGTYTNLTITGHFKTETAPGNAEIHSGLPQEITKIFENTCGSSLPKGSSLFERIYEFNKEIYLGSIYGKGTCYIPDSILVNAKPIISWWHNRTSYPQRTYIGNNCANSIDVANKTIEFIYSHKNDSFYLVIYFGAPDCAGHTYGENSSKYSDALVNVDEGIGVILDALEKQSILLDTSILLTADHGWNEGSNGHGMTSDDTKTVPLLTNNKRIADSFYSTKIIKQCDVAPTILNYFGLNSRDYQDITDANCNSLINLE